MAKDPEEWLRQADYDIETAEFLFNGRKYIYAVFMCHLAIEKALKGLYQKGLNEAPPKVHNLIYLIEKIGLKTPDDLYDMIFNLNRVSIPTRYPDDLRRMQKDYNKTRTADILKKSKEILKWLRGQLKK
ncbi:MAG: HEPN domain-containing protein [Thermodesulfobacteriota bacterium]